MQNSHRLNAQCNQQFSHQIPRHLQLLGRLKMIFSKLERPLLIPLKDGSNEGWIFKIRFLHCDTKNGVRIRINPARQISSAPNSRKIFKNIVFQYFLFKSYLCHSLFSFFPDFCVLDNLNRNSHLFGLLYSTSIRFVGNHKNYLDKMAN